MKKQIVHLADGRPVIAKFHNPQPLVEQLTAVTADFSHYADRHTLGLLGIYSVDHPSHRSKRALEEAKASEIADAYSYLGLDRGAEYRRIARSLGPMSTDVWLTSTSDYVNARDALDAEVVRGAQRIRVSEQYHREIAGDEVVNAAYSLGA